MTIAITITGTILAMLSITAPPDRARRSALFALAALLVFLAALVIP